MSRVSVGEKLSAAVAILLERGPMSISSLAEEVAKVTGSKVTTTRSQLSMAVSELVERGILMDAGTDRFGSRLIDLSPRGVALLLTMLATGFDYRYFKWGSLARYFERRLPHLIDHVRLLEAVASEWTRATLGEVSEEERADFLEDLAYALTVESRLNRYRAVNAEDIPALIEQMVVHILENYVKYGCNLDRLLEKLEKEGLIDLLKEIVQRRTTTLKLFEARRPLRELA